jgi:hypothetical protein
VSWNGTPSVVSWSVTELASAAARPVNSGAYDGLPSHEARANPPRTSAATPMIAMVRWAAVKPLT